MDNWEQIKAVELAASGRTRHSALDGIPVALPALAACQKIGAKAARVGFDWPTLDHIWGKVEEELAECTAAYHAYTAEPSPAHRAHLAEELGDTFYVLVQLARWLDLDAESTLREANAKFSRRFRYVEQEARTRGVALADLPLDEALALWQAAKQHTSADHDRRP
jgi:MazG family protein